MRSISEYWLRQFWHLTAARGLLDEADIELLDDGFAYDYRGRSATSTWLAIELAVLTLPCLVLTAKFGLTVASFALLSIFSILFLIPMLICYLWNIRVDERFRQFIAHIRHRELCLFSLRRSTTSSHKHNHMLPNKRTSFQCLQQLRHFVGAFNQSSRQLISKDVDAERLFSNFIGDEMLALASLPSTEQEENSEHLHTSSLKSLWQYMFLVRSEFLRVALLALHNDCAECQPREFLRHAGIFLHTIWRTCWLNVDTTSKILDWRRRGKTDKAASGTFAGGRKAAITPLAICKAQLEWALERLDSLEEANSTKEEVPLAEDDPLLDIVACLQHAISALKSRGREVANAHKEQQGEADLDEANEADAPKKTKMDEGRQKETEPEEDYQIFELDLAKTCTALNQQQQLELEDGWEDVNDSETSAHNPQQFGGGHNAVMHELKVALGQRKDHCLQRELRALARLRGVAPEQIASEELDRVPFSSDPIIKADDIVPASIKHLPPPVSHGPFGLASLDSVDLRSILAQRKALNGGDQLVEAFGEASDDEGSEV